MKDEKFEKLLGQDVVVLKTGSQRGMENWYLTTHGVVESLEHAYIRIRRTDIHDPVRTEPFYISFTYADFITGRYVIYTKSEFDKLSKDDIIQIRTSKRKS